MCPAAHEALIPSAGDEQGRRPVVPEMARSMTVGQCLEGLESKQAPHQTAALIASLCGVRRQRTTELQPVTFQSPKLAAAMAASLSPRLASHECGNTPSFIWRPSFSSRLGDVWWRLPFSKPARAPSLSTERADAHVACGRKTHTSSSSTLCYRIFMLITG